MTRAPRPQPPAPNPLAGLWAEFRKLPAAMRTDDARYAWSSDQLHRPVTTWKTLTAGEIKRLIKAAKEESGSGPGYRAVLIAKMACELWLTNWDETLRDRLQTRFNGISTLNALTPAQAHAMMEEIQSCIGRRDGVGIEEVRARFARPKGKG